MYKNNVKFVQRAVSNKPGKAKFHFDKKGFLADRKKGTRTDRKKGMRSTMQPLLFNEMSDDHIMVNVDTLTNILDKNKAPKETSIISIDTEGLVSPSTMVGDGGGLDEMSRWHGLIPQDKFFILSRF